MTEKPPDQPPALSPEELKRQEQEDQYQAWLKDHPEQLVSPDARADSEPHIAEFNALVDAFEAKHPLEALHAIVDLTPADAPNHPVREPARKDLGPIVTKLNFLEKKTNIPPARYEELKARYKAVSQAVGMINGDKIDHTR